MPTSFSHIVLRLFTLPLLLLQSLQNPKHYFCYRYLYYDTTLLLNTLLQILSYPGVVELTTQLLIHKNILWLPWSRINQFGLNTLPTKVVMQVLFHKHVWLFTTYMPTLHWWTGASSVSPYVIAITWGIASAIIIHHWSIAYELFIYCSSLIYFSVSTVTTTTKTQELLSLLLPPLPLLSYYFATKYFAADTKLSRCGWIDNSTANTQEYSLAPLVSNQ